MMKVEIIVYPKYTNSYTKHHSKKILFNNNKEKTKSPNEILQSIENLKTKRKCTNVAITFHHITNLPFLFPFDQTLP